MLGFARLSFCDLSLPGLFRFRFVVAVAMPSVGGKRALLVSLQGASFCEGCLNAVDFGVGGSCLQGDVVDSKGVFH